MLAHTHTYNTTHSSIREALFGADKNIHVYSLYCKIQMCIRLYYLIEYYLYYLTLKFASRISGFVQRVRLRAQVCLLASITNGVIRAVHEETNNISHQPSTRAKDDLCNVKDLTDSEQADMDNKIVLLLYSLCSCEQIAVMALVYRQMLLAQHYI